MNYWLSGGTAPTDFSRDASGNILTVDFWSPGSVPTGGSSDVVVVQTSYGGPPGGTEPAGLLDGGAVGTATVEVPEPATIVAGLLLLLPFGASTLRTFRKS